MSELIDGTRQMRAGEELDLEALGSYLRGRPELGGADGELTVEQFPGGHSNLTYLVRLGQREWVLRRPPFGSKVKTAHDMGREYAVLSKLAPVYPKAPAPLVLCEDEAVIGARFYLMQRVRGVILRKEPPAGLAIDARTATRLSEVFVETLVELHRIDYRQIGLAGFGRPDGYVERQVRGWTERYARSQTDEIAEVGRIASWLADNLPASSAASIIHNDYKFDNMVLDPDDLTRVLGILDWEMSTVGEPLMDLGTALCYWVEADDPAPLHLIRFCPTHLPGMLTRQQIVDRYLQQSEIEPAAPMTFYYAFGLFKTAVVAQQIYYRYRQGLTKDQRFAQFIHAVRILVGQAGRCIDSGKL